MFKGKGCRCRRVGSPTRAALLLFLQMPNCSSRILLSPRFHPGDYGRRSRFLGVLRSRRSIIQVPLSVEPAKRVEHPLYQDASPPKFSEVMDSCPRKNISNFKDLLKEENLYLITEAYASRGYIAVAVDSRYHGERAHNLTTYRDALIASWKKEDMMPFIFDTVWDLIKLADYLTQREDMDCSRIGITGESLGGIRWAIDNDMWQGRVDSIKPVFEEARIDLRKSAIDREVVEKVWDWMAPGLTSDFDSPNTIPAIAPRPLLILNGEADPRCPIAGLKVPESRARDAYQDALCPENFQLNAQPGMGHLTTPWMVKEASDWFDKFLKQ